MSISPKEYFSFWRKSCIRDDFTPQYFTLGLVEEISEVSIIYVRAPKRKNAYRTLMNATLSGYGRDDEEKERYRLCS